MKKNKSIMIILVPAFYVLFGIYYMYLNLNSGDAFFGFVMSVLGLHMYYHLNIDSRKKRKKVKKR